MAMRRSLVYASMLMVVSIVVLANLSGISADQYDCGGDLPSIVTTCGMYIVIGEPQMKPSQECCGELATTDIPCLCEKYISMYEGRISPVKTIFVAKTCRRPVPAGLSCGSYTVPPVSAEMPEE